MLRFAVLAALVAAFVFLAPLVHAHEPYSELKDPVTQQDCCGDQDCNILKIEPGVLTAVDDGYLITLTGQQASSINPKRTYPVSFVVPWARVQPSWDGNYRVCIAPDPYMGWEHPDRFYCFFAPPNT
jgi:hypothetical protein